MSLCCVWALPQVLGMNQLQHLKLGSAPKLTDASVHHISSSCPLLESLGLVDCNITDRAFDTRYALVQISAQHSLLLGLTPTTRVWNPWSRLCRG